MPGINEKLLAKLVLPIPDQTLQEQIVEDFEAIDSADAQLRRRLSEIGEQKRLLLTLI